MQLGLHLQGSQVPAGVPNHYAAVQQFPTQTLLQRPQLVQNQVPQHGQVLAQSGVSSVSAVRPLMVVGMAVGAHTHTTTSSPLNQQMQPLLLQNVGQVPPPTNSGYHDHLMSQTDSTHPSIPIHPRSSAAGFQPGSSTSSAVPDNMDQKGHASSFPGNTKTINNNIDQIERASKMVKLSNGRATLPLHASNIITPLSATSSKLPGRQTSMAQETLNSEKQASQMQLPADVDSTLLQQVLNLTPEQLSSLPTEQQQQVIQLQQMLGMAT